MAGAGEKHSFGAEAKSGAGGGTLGFAGSLALNIANVTTTAAIKPARRPRRRAAATSR